MMTEADRPDKELDALFAMARTDNPPPSADLLARVLKDAAAEQPSTPVLATSPRPGVLRRALDAIGGWPTLGGLATATVVGFVVGISPSTLIDTSATSLFGQTDTLALYDADMGGLGWDAEEG